MRGADGARGAAALQAAQLAALSSDDEDIMLCARLEELHRQRDAARRTADLERAIVIGSKRRRGPAHGAVGGPRMRKLRARNIQRVRMIFNN